MADFNRPTSQLCCCPRRYRTEKHRRVRRAAPGSSRWIQRSRETGEGSATRSPRRAGRQAPLGEACCWSRLTGHSAAGTGDPPGIQGPRGESGNEEERKGHVYHNMKMLTGWDYCTGTEVFMIISLIEVMHVSVTSLVLVLFHNKLSKVSQIMAVLQRSEELTCSHSRSTRPWKPLMVLQAGSRMIWAKEVTCRVESVPSVPWTSTDAPSLRHTHTYTQLLSVWYTVWCNTAIFSMQRVQSRWNVNALLTTGPGLIQQADFVNSPVDTLCSQAGSGEDLFDMSLPAGRLELA